MACYQYRVCVKSNKVGPLQLFTHILGAGPQNQKSIGSWDPIFKIPSGKAVLKGPYYLSLDPIFNEVLGPRTPFSKFLFKANTVIVNHLMYC